MRNAKTGAKHDCQKERKAEEQRTSSGQTWLSIGILVSEQLNIKDVSATARTVSTQLITCERMSEFEKVKQEKDGIEFKIKKFDKASKDLDHLLGSQIIDKSKKGLGYSAVPPPHLLIYNRPKKLDLSYSSPSFRWEFKEPDSNGMVLRMKTRSDAQFAFSAHSSVGFQVSEARTGDVSKHSLEGNQWRISLYLLMPHLQPILGLKLLDSIPEEDKEMIMSPQAENIEACETDEFASTPPTSPQNIILFFVIKSRAVTTMVQCTVIWDRDCLDGWPHDGSVAIPTAAWNQRKLQTVLSMGSLGPLQGVRSNKRSFQKRLYGLKSINTLYRKRQAPART
ncbi:hypothetical protein Tco_0000023 [Tanacetum coccineum]